MIKVPESICVFKGHHILGVAPCCLSLQSATIILKTYMIIYCSPFSRVPLALTCGVGVVLFAPFLSCSSLNSNGKCGIIKIESSVRSFCEMQAGCDAVLAHTLHFALSSWCPTAIVHQTVSARQN